MKLEIVCPRCNVAHPEDEPHECVSRWRRGLWPLELAIGIGLLAVGATAAYVWRALAQGGFDSFAGKDFPVFPVFTIVPLVLGVCLVALAARHWE